MMEHPKANSSSAWAVLRRRLVSNRFLLLVSIALFGYLYLDSRIEGWLFAVLGCIMVAVGALTPFETGARRRRAAGAAVAASEEMTIYATALDSVPDPILLIDQRGAVRHANRQFQRVLGDMQPGASVMIRFRSPEIVEMVQTALAGGRPEPVELIERAPREHWFLVSIAALTVRSDSGPLYLLHLRDLSELRRAERMRTDFIANASHELRTPLASLAGFIETLAGPARDDAPARDRFLSIMHDQAERMSRLIDDLLSLSRFETALGRSDFTKVDLVDTLVHVRSAFLPVAGRDDTVLSLDQSAMPDGGGFVHGSRDELIQLFDNLVENAIKYGGVGKRVDIVIAPAQLGELPAFAVEVTDQGPGIAEEHIPRLTERFYRVDVETSRGKQGTGLGLAIVKHIVTRHEGRLSIHSRPNEGTTVVVTFPAMESGNASERQKSHENSIA